MEQQTNQQGGYQPCDVRVLADRGHPQFEAALLSWMSYIVAFLRRKTVDLFLIEDVAQETIIRVMLNIDKYDPQLGSREDNGRNWVATIAVNILRSALRKTGREQFVDDDSMFDLLVDDNERGRPDRLFQELEEVEILRYALLCTGRFRLKKRCSYHLEEKDKKIFLLSFNAGLRNNEIAEMLDMQEKSVKNSRDYSLKKIRRCSTVQWVSNDCRLYDEFRRCRRECPCTGHSAARQLTLDYQLAQRNSCRTAREGGFGPCELTN